MSISRSEFSAMAELGAKQGTIAQEEFTMLQNLLLFGEMKVEQAMTPRTVVFSLRDSLTVEEFFHKYDKTPFTRILVYHHDEENIVGFVIRNDLLLAQARGNFKSQLKIYCRPIGAMLDTSPLSHTLKEMMKQRAQIMLLVDEYGTMQGIITMEDLIETLLGLEIIDEKDTTKDMQQLARKLWKKKMKLKGINLSKN